MSLINWLKSKPTPRFYGSSRAGYGIASEHQHPVVGSFGFLRFDKNQPTDRLWEPFGDSRFIVPTEVRLGEIEGHHPSPDSNPLTPRLKCAGNWPSIVQQALNQIQSGQLEKVVLAQRRVLTCPTPIDPLTLLERLKNYFPKAHHFYYEPRPGLVFLGASPERLYKRIGQRIETEAQAGTRLCGQELSQELLESSKDHHEHQIVVNNILNALSGLCIDYGITKPKHIVTLPNVQHLKTNLAGLLKNSVTDQDILEALHPTAAVCGWPIQQAYETIRNLEGFDRGLYAGALGYIDEHESEFNVAIRSAVIQDNKLYAFAGAGIVSGSTAKDEEQEIANKMAFWEKLL
jgi:menaquinone-specific isochorismate synthase